MANDLAKEPKRQVGRPKGSKNKHPGILKEAILLAAENVGNKLEKGGGLVKYLEKQAKDNPVAFMGIMGKVLTLQSSEKDLAASRRQNTIKVELVPVAKALPKNDIIDVTPEGIDAETDKAPAEN